jgi:acyl phosphate:glycerol-3-phosphate acyltransferase
MTDLQHLLLYVLIVVISYLIGSIPTAYLIGKARNVNIFEVGSGNMGGTNVARAMGGIQWGVLTIILDALKGIVSIFIAIKFIPLPTSEYWGAFTVSGIVAVIGHNWSLFATLIVTAANQGRLTIRGGKGGATAFGTLLMVAPVQTVIGMLAIGGYLVLRTRYVSLGVLTAFGVALLWLTVLIMQEILPVALIPYIVIIGSLIAWRFRENIQSLLAGKERRLGETA